MKSNQTGGGEKIKFSERLPEFGPSRKWQPCIFSRGQAGPMETPHSYHTYLTYRHMRFCFLIGKMVFLPLRLEMVEFSIHVSISKAAAIKSVCSHEEEDICLFFSGKNNVS